MLAGALGLMPGTISTILTGGWLRVHVLDGRLPAAGAVALDAHLARLHFIAGVIPTMGASYGVMVRLLPPVELILFQHYHGAHRVQRAIMPLQVFG